ncbi:tetratricopeptide repeat protein, partial [Yinghuangia sp. YIM S09857]|uniref:tetratricopeptide repeat protein n=1 Tax=Yinghuangia sp. YIM S09857 TaxID=3436929 RepID=UPI003F534572
GHNTAGLLPLARNVARTLPPPEPAEVSAAEVANTAFEVGVRLAAVLHDAGAVREAVQILTTLWDSRDPSAEPEDLRLHLDLASLRAELGQVAEAVEVLEEAFAHAAAGPHPRPEVGGVCLALARLLRETGDYPRACDVLEFAVEVLSGPLADTTFDVAPETAVLVPAVGAAFPSAAWPGGGGDARIPPPPGHPVHAAAPVPGPGTPPGLPGTPAEPPAPTGPHTPLVAPGQAAPTWSCRDCGSVNTAAFCTACGVSPGASTG